MLRLKIEIVYYLYRLVAFLFGIVEPLHSWAFRTLASYLKGRTGKPKALLALVVWGLSSISDPLFRASLKLSTTVLALDLRRRRLTLEKTNA